MRKKKNKDYVLVYEEYNANPIKRRVSDCSIRAFCKMFKLSWETVFDELSTMAREFKTVITTASMHDAYLEQKGLHRKWTNSQGELGYFKEMQSGEYIVLCKNLNANENHIVCIKNGTVFDSFDSRDYKVLEWWYYKIDDYNA